MSGRSRAGRALRSTACALAVFLFISSAAAGDLGIVPLFDGERSDALNLWGGPFLNGSITSFGKQSTVVHSGSGAYQGNLGTISSGSTKFFQTFSSSLPSNSNYR